MPKAGPTCKVNKYIMENSKNTYEHSNNRLFIYEIIMFEIESCRVFQ